MPSDSPRDSTSDTAEASEDAPAKVKPSGPAGKEAKHKSLKERNEGARPLKKKKRRPLTEEQIDSPDRQTLIMLGVLSGLTIVLWGFARGACNYHPPRETRRPRAVAIAELAQTPKDAALEFEQRLATKDFDGALSLATGAVEADVRQQKAACDASPQCKADRAKLEQTVLSSAALLERDFVTATVRVTTQGLPQGADAHILRVERGANMWKVSSVQAAPVGGVQAPSVPHPAPSAAEVPLVPPAVASALPAPSASAAVRGHAPKK